MVTSDHRLVDAPAYLTTAGRYAAFTGPDTVFFTGIESVNPDGTVNAVIRGLHRTGVVTV